MRSIRRFLWLAVLVIPSGTAGCYHAMVDTGALPDPDAPTVIEWRHSFLWGLVPPDPVELPPLGCRGAATVHTRISPLNALVTVLTVGIYSPMEVRVLCAGGE